MSPTAAKPQNKAEMIRLVKAGEPSISDEELATRVGASVQRVRQALRSKGVPLKRGLRA
jgi:predicted transcriptional regulator